MAPRAVEHADEHGETVGKALKRRGLIAGAAALVAGMAAARTAESVAAGTDGDVILGFPNSTTVGYTTVQNANNSDGHAALVGVRSLSATLFPYAVDSGIQGISDLVNAVGVQGVCNAAFGVGVVGESDSYYGVEGYTNTGIGVVGSVSGGGVGTSNIGVLGQVGSSQPNTIAVYGQNRATGTNSVGVIGQSDPATGIGTKGISAAGTPVVGSVEGSGSGSNGHAAVLGKGTAGPGVQGQSASGHGLIGYTTATDGHAALIGYAQTAGAVGLIGVAPGSAGHWAGVFYGDVHVNGTASAPVHTAVAKLPSDGTYRSLYSTTSPEAWVEDFGRGTLAGDKADIKLDANFAALVHTDDYHIFVTAHGPQHLHIEQQNATGFRVVATAIGGAVGGPKPAEGGGTFAWRVVAKRKDITGERLAKVAVPSALKAVTPFAVPETPEPKPPSKKP